MAVVPIREVRNSLSPGADEQSADSLCFEQIYRRHGKALYGFLCYQLGDIPMAEELFAVVCERIFVNLRRYQSRRGSLVTWLFSIARNAVIDERRRRRVPGPLQLGALPEQESADPSPEEALLRQDENKWLARLVSELPLREREVVSLKFSGGLSNTAMAQLLGLREGHVAVILHRAIHRLRRHLQQEAGT